MAKVITQLESTNLDLVAKQIGECSLLTIPKSDHIVLRIAAKFAVKAFKTNQYSVSVGLTQAILRLSHPSYDSVSAYQATVDKSFWAETWKSQKKRHTEVSGSVEAKTGFLQYLGLRGKFSASIAADQEEALSGKKEYQIVKAIPGGWEIGSDLGEPRTPAGTTAKGLEFCLQGEYLTGRNGENGDGMKDEALAGC